MQLWENVLLLSMQISTTFLETICQKYIENVKPWLSFDLEAPLSWIYPDVVAHIEKDACSLYCCLQQQKNN